MDLCRSCLSSTDLIELNEEIIANYNQLTDLNVVISDGLPQCICSKCKQVVIGFIKFRNKAHSSEIILQNSVQHVKDESFKNVGLQKEIKLENDDFEMLMTGSDATESDFNDDVQILIVGEGNLKTEGLEYNNDEVITEEFTSDTNDLLVEKELKSKRRRKITKKNSNTVTAKVKKEPKVPKQQNVKKTVSRYQRKRKLENTTNNNTETTQKTVSKRKTRRLSNSKVKAEPEVKSENSIEIKIEGTINDTVQLIPKKPLEERRTYQCGLCPAEYSKKTLLTPHVETHKESGTCMICNKKYATWVELLVHRMEHLPDNQKYCHICRSCCSLNSSSVELHYRIYHYYQGTALTCIHCDAKFKRQSALYGHVREKHGETKYFCDHCSKGFCSRGGLRSHLISHTEGKPYACHLCEYSTKYQPGLKEHILRCHTISRVICKKCERNFKDQEACDKHFCYNPIVICPICGKELTKRKLQRHINAHTRGPRQCPRCPKQFTTSGALNVHLDRHNNFKRQCCEYCPARFYSQSVLIKHRRTHTGERPYVCNRCGKGFTGNHNLKLHMRVHGEFLIKKKTKVEE